MTTRSGLPPSSSPSTTRSAKRPPLAGAFTPRLYNRSYLGLGGCDQGHVLVSLVADADRGARRAVRDPRASSRPSAARHPRGSLRHEPLERGADQAAARPSRRAARTRRGSRQPDEDRALAQIVVVERTAQHPEERRRDRAWRRLVRGFEILQLRRRRAELAAERGHRQPTSFTLLGHDLHVRHDVDELPAVAGVVVERRRVLTVGQRDDAVLPTLHGGSLSTRADPAGLRL